MATSKARLSARESSVAAMESTPASSNDASTPSARSAPESSPTMRRTSACATANLARFGGRGAAVGGSFFDAFPPAFRACDVFVVRGVLMDWPDAEATTILRRVAEAAKPGAKLVVNEFVLGTAGKMMERAKHLMDLNMAASCAPGARVRAVADHRALLEAAGVDLASFSHLRIRSIVDVLEVTF